MPIYKYSCEKCGSQIEVIQKISDPPLKRCVKCRGKLTKAVSRTSFQLKGSGWYATDYPAKSAPVENAKTEKTTEKAEKSVIDSKPESVSKTTATGDKD